jgi:hypothetical protein
MLLTVDCSWIFEARLEFTVATNCWKSRAEFKRVFEVFMLSSDKINNRLLYWASVVPVLVLTTQSTAVLLGDEDGEVDVVDVPWVEREGWLGSLFGSLNAPIDGYWVLLMG